jgi:electron transport complex protein RnfC
VFISPNPLKCVTFLAPAGISATASAFVQNRKKLSWMDFEKILDVFNSYHSDTKTYKGYRILAVDGTAVNEPKNLIVPVGTPIRCVLDAAGGVSEDVGKILYGGPMMGVAIYSVDDPILKSTNAIVALKVRDAFTPRQYACIHCGRCVQACPMGLNPTAFVKAMKVDDKYDRAERLEDAKLNLCLECGCCSFVCPSRRPLVENHRLAKSDLRLTRSEKKN